MPVREPRIRARHFFLNEKHELATREPERHGRSPSFEPIDWEDHATNLRESFRRAVSVPKQSHDPSVEKHRFAVAVPAELTKRSSSKKAQSTGGLLSFVPAFGGPQALVLSKLGFELISVREKDATVHVAAQRLPQFQAKLDELAGAGRRDRDRWINIGTFRPIDWTDRVSVQWLSQLEDDSHVDAHVRFFAVIPRPAIEGVLAAIRRELRDGEHLLRTGRDFSGRHWCMARLTRNTISRMAREFPSIQSIHPPLTTELAAVSSRSARSARSPRSNITRPPADVSELPIIGMLDAGIPEDHATLRAYVAGRYRDPILAQSLQPQGSHGCLVASVLVFGPVMIDGPPGPSDIPPATCRVFDMLGTWNFKPARIPDEVITRAIQNVQGVAPDVRVFNLSLHGPPIHLLDPKDREEKLLYLQDIDNLAFTTDTVLVIAAGNSPAGALPTPPYPRHIDNDAWKLGVLATSFNGLVVGACVDEPLPGGIVHEPGAPSAFTRVGPGRLRAPVPSFGAPGGDYEEHEDGPRTRGIWGVSADGLWEDGGGTSLAAPLVAREAAFVFRDLTPFCVDTQPFAATVRALLHIFATRATFKGALEKLAARTLGRGRPASELLRRPRQDRALFVWQTTLPEPLAVARVQIPVPGAWRGAAQAARLRLVVAWLTPVNAALDQTWACRRIRSKLKPDTSDDASPLRAKPGAKGAYPVTDRVFDISDTELRNQEVQVASDLWVLEVHYDELGPAPAGMEFTTHQKVGVAVELYDEGDEPVSPQPAVQAVPVAPMNRLSIMQLPVEIPLIVR